MQNLITSNVYDIGKSKNVYKAHCQLQCKIIKAADFKNIHILVYI
jgi:hypothetical protein